MSYIYPDRFVTPLPAAAAAATGVTGNDIDASTGKGILLFINVTAITGTTPTLTVTLEGKDEVSGQYYTILASTAINATGLVVLRVYPGLTAAANLVANDVTPCKVRVRSTIGGTTPAVTATYGMVIVE